MSFQKPKAILFDWDNTLANTWPVIHAALHETFIAMGQTPWSLEETKLKVHRSMRDSFPGLFGDRWEEAGKIYQASYRKNRTVMLEALPMAHELLSMLVQDKDIYVAVVSNKIGTTLREEVTHLEWDPYFSRIVGAQDAKEDKPSPAPVALALEGSGINAGEHVWFIGDSLTDMECAHNAGCLPVFYGDGDPTSEQYKHCPAARHVKSHQELMAWLGEISG